MCLREHRSAVVMSCECWRFEFHLMHTTRVGTEVGGYYFLHCRPLLNFVGNVACRCFLRLGLIVVLHRVSISATVRLCSSKSQIEQELPVDLTLVCTTVSVVVGTRELFHMKGRTVHRSVLSNSLTLIKQT